MRLTPRIGMQARAPLGAVDVRGSSPRTGPPSAGSPSTGPPSADTSGAGLPDAVSPRADTTGAGRSSRPGTPR